MSCGDQQAVHQGVGRNGQFLRGTAICRRNNYHVHYEDAPVAIATQQPLKVVKDMAWCEIDDPSHYERAVSVVYPKYCNGHSKKYVRVG